MSFCPKCKSEYINGRPTCADCGTPLVESLEETYEKILDDAMQYEDATETADDIEEGNDTSSDETAETTEKTKPERLYAFVSKKEKYKDYLSTGYTFLIVGIAGLVVITLNLLNVIQIFNTSGASSVLFYCVMYTMFFIFLFVSANSFKNSKRLKAEADTEDTFLKDMNTYLLENITSETFDNMEIPESEEELYFHRTEIIKEKLLEKYPDIDNSLLEQTIDETYDRLF